MTEESGPGQAQPPNVFPRPPDLLEFVSTEHQQFLTSLVNCHDELQILAHVHGLYTAAMTEQTVDASRAVIFQLLTFVHYHFLFASSTYLRCHMAEGFSSARAAIDGALIAAQIIHDRPSQVAYINRTKPFDKLIRHFKNLVKDKKPLPHPNIEYLIDRHQFCSQFASHADVETFLHRLDFHGGPGEMMSFGYFQFVRDLLIFKSHFLSLLHIFVASLDVFAGFLVNEHRCVPQAWADELHHVGGQIERHRQQLQQSQQA